MTVLSAVERDAVARQLGREPTTSFEVAARCVEPGPAGTHPLVIRNHPVDPGGNPFPTLFWLTCPQAVKAVSRLESTGEIGRLNERFDHDDSFRESVERAHAEYASERAREHPPAGAWGGVGGTRTGVKCLHAHYANHLAGGDDPIGRVVAAAVSPVHPDEPRSGRVAAFDIGSNTVRLLVAHPATGGDEPLLDVCRDTVVTRLGKGVDERGRIDPESLRASLEILGRFGRKAAALGTTNSRVAATSAVRDADNRNELGEGIREATGVDMEVIAGEEEAGLSFVGATRTLDRPGPFLVMDIGGGSTEFVVGDDEPREAISTQMGSVRMTERVAPADPPTRNDLDRIEHEVDAVLSDVPEWARHARTFVAVAGTATTVQAVALGLDTYDPDRIHRSTLTVEDAERAMERLAGMTAEERIALPVMVPGRADVIVAGAVILIHAMRALGFHEVVVSETDILDGLAFQLLVR